MSIYNGDVYASVRQCFSRHALALHDDWRLLWEQHVAWTRMTILSAAYNSPDLAVTIARLLKNPGDMGAVMRVFYGDAVANQFTKLMTEHLQLAIKLVLAAKAKDAAATAQAEKEWYANADEIAHFMAGINPYWREEALKAMLHEHLALTEAEAVASLAGDYQKSADLYDRIEPQALGMADAFSSGIVSQFPGAF